MFVYTLHHSNNIESLLREAARVTKKEIIILDHTYTSWLSLDLLKAYDYAANFMYGMPIPFNFLRIREWLALFQRNKLKVLEASIPSAMMSSLG